MTNFQQVVNTPKIAIFKYYPGHSKPRLTKVGRGFSFGLRDRKRRPEQIEASAAEYCSHSALNGNPG
jgi:hypothetical protein